MQHIIRNDYIVSAIGRKSIPLALLLPMTEIMVNRVNPRLCARVSVSNPYTLISVAHKHTQTQRGKERSVKKGRKEGKEKREKEKRSYIRISILALSKRLARTKES